MHGPDELETLLEHRFSRPDLLAHALTHPSLTKRRKPSRGAPYERLEFLGDRVLGLVVADMLFSAFPSEAEGALARRFTALVRREAVARVARDIGLEGYLAMAGCEAEGGGPNEGVLADACEAMIGALYADGGFEPASRFVRRHWTPLMAEDRQPPKDAKTALQEWAQGRGLPLPAYSVLGAEGPPHDPVFRVAVAVDGHPPREGLGSSKRAAEQAAATALLNEVRP